MKLFKKESKIEKEEYFSFCVEEIYKHKNPLRTFPHGAVYRNHLLYFRDKWLYKEEEKREKAEEFPKGKNRYQKNGSRNLSI